MGTVSTGNNGQGRCSRKGDKDKAEVFLREIADMVDAPAGLRNMIKGEMGRL